MNVGGRVCLTLGETSDGTGSGCPWCPCDPEAPGRAGVWSSTLSGGSTPSLSRRSTVGSRSRTAAAVPAPCTAERPSQKTYPGKERAGRGESSARAPTKPGLRHGALLFTVRARTSADVSIHAGHTLDLHNPLMHICSGETDKLFRLPVL